MKFENGDSIKFGELYCRERRMEEFIGKVIMMTPQYFEEDNGLYVYDSICAGIYNEESKEADSVYHLFGNDFENFMDCELIKGTEEDKKKYERIIKAQYEAEAKAWEDFVNNI